METLGNFGLCLSHIAKLGYGFWGEIAREDVWTVNREFFSNLYIYIFKSNYVSMCKNSRQLIMNIKFANTLLNLKQTHKQRITMEKSTSPQLSTNIYI